MLTFDLCLFQLLIKYLLPEELQHVSTLEILTIWGLSGLATLPDWIARLTSQNSNHQMANPTKLKPRKLSQEFV